jgi:hypothetical protein
VAEPRALLANEEKARDLRFNAQAVRGKVSLDGTNTPRPPRGTAITGGHSSAARLASDTRKSHRRDVTNCELSEP